MLHTNGPRVGWRQLGWLAVGGVVGGGAIWATRRWARLAEQHYPPVGQSMVVEGILLHYVRQGQGRPLVLLHGSDGFLQDFESVFAPLTTCYDVIALDRPGHGYSGLPPGETLTPRVQARLLHGLLQVLGISRPLLVGHSWSGLLALTYALEYPDDVAGLLLLAPWAYAPERPSLLLTAIARVPLIGGGVGSLLLPLVKPFLVGHFLQQGFAPASVPPAYARQAQSLWQRWPRQIVAFAQENVEAGREAARVRERCARLTLPVVIVAGEADRTVNPDHHALPLHACLPHSELRLLPGVGHALLHTAPREVIAAVDRCAALAEEYAPEPGGRRESDYERARRLVFCYGWNATAYQILNPGMAYWFPHDGEAVVGYVRRHGVCIVAGAPVCAPDRVREVAQAFETHAREAGERVCYFGAAGRLRTALQGSRRHTTLVVGAQPVWNPAHWPGIVARNRSLRAQCNRAANKGVRAAEWGSERAASSEELQTCLREWLASHPFPTLHFLTEPVGLDRLADRRVWVAEQNGAAVGFLIATPIPDREGWLFEQIVRGAAAPNGTIESLIDGAMRRLAEEGSRYVTLGLAPLSRRAPTPEVAASWLRLLLAGVRAHGQRFYNFEGLDAFKAKFKPDAWEPIYAIAAQPHFTPRTLYALGAAFSEGPPLRAFARALAGAARQEWNWLRQRVPPSTETAPPPPRPQDTQAPQ